MSLNIIIDATGTILRIRHTEIFDVLQTPTVVTHAILDSSDPIQKYKDWVMEHGDNAFNNEHCDKLDEFINKWEGLGFKIEVSYI